MCTKLWDNPSAVLVGYVSQVHPPFLLSSTWQSAMQQYKQKKNITTPQMFPFP